MADQEMRERNRLIQQLEELYQDLISEGVLEDMELYHIDPIRMVDSEMGAFIRKLTGAAAEPEEGETRETAVFASSILAAAESLPQNDPERATRLEEIKAPLERSVALLTRIIEDENAVRVSKEALRQNVEILRKCLERLEQGP